MATRPFQLEVNELSIERNYRPIFVPYSFSLTNGESLYLKGRNGAGKTTSLRVISGASQRYKGEIFLDNVERRELLHHYPRVLTYVGHQLSLNLDLTAEENLEFILKLRGQFPKKSEIKEVFKLLDLPERARPVRFYSAGQKRRVALSRLWLEEAPLWILDEPFTALDVDSIALLEEKMKAHLAKGGGIIFTSHQAPSETVYTHELTIERADHV